MAGLMGVTAFLSMWINNSAAASIMLPVALAITDELERHSKSFQAKKHARKEASAAVNGDDLVSALLQRELSSFVAEYLDLTRVKFIASEHSHPVVVTKTDAPHAETPLDKKYDDIKKGLYSFAVGTRSSDVSP